MANRSLSLENALEILKIIESIEDYSYKEEELYKFNLLQEYDFNFVSNKIHKPFLLLNFTGGGTLKFCK